jgi:ATP adenylyltransferase
LREPAAESVSGCLACDLADGRVPLPGGRIHEAGGWIVEHCVGPLGVGTLIVKPARHVVRVSKLSLEEAAALGPLLRRVAAVVERLTAAPQVYVCLWSHAGRQAGHIHFVVQPATTEAIGAYDAHGPHLQVAMFDAAEPLPGPDVDAFSARAREALAQP